MVAKFERVAVPYVAPHWGAWIEIVRFYVDDLLVRVAPHWGAWIEIGTLLLANASGKVAPHWGAWIEIICLDNPPELRGSRTPLGCVD